MSSFLKRLYSILSLVALIAFIYMSLGSTGLFVFKALVIFCAVLEWALCLFSSRLKFSFMDFLVISGIAMMIFGSPLLLLLGTIALTRLIFLPVSWKELSPHYSLYIYAFLTAYLGVGVSAFLSASMNQQLHTILTAIFVDTLGYLSGSLFSSSKIGWTVSPQKTYVGYLVASLGTFLMMLHFSTSALSLILQILGAILGDLYFSLAKRIAGKKDFSQLMPGHGGILDRIDSWIGVAVISVLIHYYGIR